MSKSFKGFMKTGWKITACLSFLIVLISIIALVMAQIKPSIGLMLAPSKPLGILAYVGLIGGIAVTMNAIGARVLHSFMLVLPSIFVIVDVSIGGVFFVQGCIISAILAFALSLVYKKVKGIQTV